MQEVRCRFSRCETLRDIGKGCYYTVWKIREADYLSGPRIEFLIFNDKGHWEWVPAEYFEPAED